MVGAGFVSPVINTSFGMSFAVARVDTSDMDFGKQDELIGKRVESLPNFGWDLQSHS